MAYFPTRRSFLPIILLGVFLLACGITWPGGISPRGGGPVYFGRETTNGEQLYFTAVNDRGETISYTDGPAYGGMMDGRLACVSCHGVMDAVACVGCICNK